MAEVISFKERVRDIEMIANSPVESLLATERAKMFINIMEHQFGQLCPTDETAADLYHELVETYLREWLKEEIPF